MAATKTMHEIKQDTLDTKPVKRSYIHAAGLNWVYAHYDADDIWTVYTIIQQALSPFVPFRSPLTLEIFLSV